MQQVVIKIMEAAGGQFAAVNYNANEKRESTGMSRLVHFRNFGYLENQSKISKEEFKIYLQDWSPQNSRIKNPSFHAVLSCKGQELTHEELKDMAVELMDRLGYKNNPVLIYSHHDTKNNHVHIVSTRVGEGGKKINDSFEKKRAREIVNEILNRNVNYEFANDLNKANSYRFRTQAQFALLMEIAGYKARIEDGEMKFFKYGSLAGSAAIESIKEKLSQPPQRGDKNIRKIQALIYKYCQSHTTSIQVSYADKYHKSPPIFKSELSDHLKKQFGLEFAFFAAPAKDTPYGFAIIDHKNHEVYKGSDVMGLESFIALSEDKPSQTEVITKINRNQTPEKEDINKNTSPLQDMSFSSDNVFHTNTSTVETAPIPTKSRNTTDDDEDDWKRKRRKRR